MKKTHLLLCSFIVLAAATAGATEPDAFADANLMLDQMNSGWGLTILVLGIEGLIRAVPTKNPKSLLYTVSGTLKLIAKGADMLAKGADMVLQKTKDKS